MEEKLRRRAVSTVSSEYLAITALDLALIEAHKYTKHHPGELADTFLHTAYGIRRALTHETIGVQDLVMMHSAAEHIHRKCLEVQGAEMLSGLSRSLSGWLWEYAREMETSGD